VRRALSPLMSLFTSPKYASLLEYGGTFEGAYLLRRALFMPWEIDQILDPITVKAGLDELRTLPRLADTDAGMRDDHARVAALELSWYMRNQLLRDADWAGMAHSVEVRVPLMDVNLFRTIAPWMASGKPPGKEDAAAASRPVLGAAITRRPKSGFSIPVSQWTPGRPRSHPAVSRGLRGWAKRVLPLPAKQFRALVLVTDAFGGYGGIAKFNRDLLTALGAMPECAEVIAVPRLMFEDPEGIPPRIRYRADAAGGKGTFIRAALSEALAGPLDLVIAGHINLAPVAAAIASLKRASSVLIIHGIDAWTPHRSPLVRASLQCMDRVVAVSRVTLERFVRWASIPRERCRVLPNCVDLQKFVPGPKPQGLATKLGLAGRTVIMTLGRLASQERSKGFDEVIDALPALARDIPSIAYLICGDGPDRSRLEAKARGLGVGDRVVFAGYVPEDAKADYYRVADAYVMPCRGEGFGIVFLEALSCGLPSMGSAIDGSREALLDGRLGVLVNPDQADDVLRGIRTTLSMPRRVPDQLTQFSAENFTSLVSSIINDVRTSRRAIPLAGADEHRRA